MAVGFSQRAQLKKSKWALAQPMNRYLECGFTYEQPPETVAKTG
jgi:hypothetical protein